MGFNMGKKILESGIFAVNKPSGCTSFDVVRRLKAHLREKKIGHAGTLDPMATGILIIGCGKATKRLSVYQSMRKYYTGRFMLGERRPSYDADTAPTHLCSTAHLEAKDIENLTEQFSGCITQHPPPYSALKVNGTRAYALARKGLMPVLSPRKVHIYHLEWTKIAIPEVYFSLSCEKGTYVRSWVHALGETLGVGAALHALCRTKIGDIGLKDAWEIDKVNDDILRG